MSSRSSSNSTSLKRPDPDFSWAFYLDRILKDGAGEGLHFTVIDKIKEVAAVKKAYLRTDSFGNVPLLDLPFERESRKLIKVKLKIDANPPDVQRFLPIREQEALRLWEQVFFLHHLGILAGYVVAL